jgi:ElaB/YqjD/DUF883 family membrane-anchored ribosome-binding protein
MDNPNIKNATKTLKEWSVDAKEKAKMLQDRLNKAKDETLEYVDQNPRKATLMAVGVGAAVGAIVALLISRRRD